MRVGDLVRINYSAAQFRDALHGEIGIIVSHIEGNAFAVLVGGRRIHFHKHVLEPLDGAR